MNREAVALGTPVYTTFEGRLGAVDERLIEEGRLRMLVCPEELDLGKRAAGSAPAGLSHEPSQHPVGSSHAFAEQPSEAPTPPPPRVRRDPRVLVDLLLSPLGD